MKKTLGTVVLAAVMLAGCGGGTATPPGRDGVDSPR